VNPYAPTIERLPDRELIAYLTESGRVVPVSEGIVFGADAYRRMVKAIVEHLREHDTITLAQVRDLFGTSRRYAQALLEQLDERRITRRVGDERVLRNPAAGPLAPNRGGGPLAPDDGGKGGGSDTMTLDLVQLAEKLP